MNPAVIAGWLVKLGFDVDKKSLLNMEKNLALIETRVKRATLEMAALATAYVYATKQFNGLYTYANRMGTNIAGLKILEQTFENVGGSAQDASSAIAAIANGLKYTPGFAAMLGSGFGVATSKNGKLRNTADILLDISNAVQKMSPAYAKARLEAVGLGGAIDFLRDPNFGKEFKRNAELFNGFNDSLNGGREATHEFWNEANRTGEILKTGILAAVGEIAKSTGLQDWLKSVNDWLTQILPGFIRLQGVIASMADNPFEYLVDAIFHSDEVKALEAVKNGTATAEQREMAERYETRKAGGREFKREQSAVFARGVSLDDYYGLGPGGKTITDLPQAYLDAQKTYQKTMAYEFLARDQKASAGSGDTTINVPVTVELKGDENPIEVGRIIGQTAGHEIEISAREIARSNQ